MSDDFWDHVRAARHLVRPRPRERRTPPVARPELPSHAAGAAGGASRRGPEHSGYLGVRQISPSLWEASLTHQGRRRVLGCWPTAEEAARMRDRQARRLHGDRAVLNFPEEG